MACPLRESSLQASKTLPLQPLSPNSTQIIDPSSLLGVKTLSCSTSSSSKQYLGQNSSSGTQRVDWTSIERQLLKWKALFDEGKELRIEICINYLEDDNSRTDKGGPSSATAGMPREREAQIDAERSFGQTFARLTWYITHFRLLSAISFSGEC